MIGKSKSVMVGGGSIDDLNDVSGGGLAGRSSKLVNIGGLLKLGNGGVVFGGARGGCILLKLPNGFVKSGDGGLIC